MRLPATCLRVGVLWATAACVPAADPGVAVQLTLERLDSGKWIAVDPHLVLRGGDEVRFKFRSTRAGFLYVINHDAAGRYTWLFPTRDAGEQNRIDPHMEYVIPANSGVFEIARRPGYETTYWILSPVELRAMTNMESEPNPEIEKLDQTPLLPRCDDGALTARGPCTDRHAGARQMTQATPPNWFEDTVPLQPRDVRIDDRNQRSRISMTSEASAPLIYEYRIAHR